MLCYSCRQALRSLFFPQASPSYFTKLPTTTYLSKSRRSNVIITRSATNAAQQPGSSSSPRQQGPSSSSETSAPSAISSSTPGISQPLSTPEFPSTASTSTAPSNPPPLEPQLRIPTSSVTGGQELRGLGYTKDRPTVLAMEDSEYPTWLWTLLDQDPAKTGKASAGPDVSGTYMIDFLEWLWHSFASISC